MRTGVNTAVKAFGDHLVGKFEGFSIHDRFMCVLDADDVIWVGGHAFTVFFACSVPDLTPGIDFVSQESQDGLG